MASACISLVSQYSDMIARCGWEFDPFSKCFAGHGASTANEQRRHNWPAPSYECHQCCAELTRSFFSRLISTRLLPVCLAPVPSSAATRAFPMPTT
jgi:hypothetical protein